MEMKGKGFLPKKEECSSSSRKSSGPPRCPSASLDDSRASYQMNGHMGTAYTHKDCSEIHVKRTSSSSLRRAYDMHSYNVNMENEEVCEKKSRKERDKDAACSSPKALPDSYKSAPSCSDQDLEFYPIDEYNPTPSTFTAWDAFMAGNQAYFREPCCVTDYSCTGDSFAYMDVIPEEDASVLESDTDDTGSSVSTVIDKFSRASTANSSFSERIKTKEEPPLVTFDLEQVLSPFEQLEKELDEGTGSELISKVMNGDYDLSECPNDSPRMTDGDYVDSERLPPVLSSGNQSNENMQSYFAGRFEKDEIQIESFPHTGHVENNISSPAKDNEESVMCLSSLETPDGTIVPPVPARVRSLSVPKDISSKIAKSKNEEKVSQLTPPPVVPRKREPYPTPNVPPRMSKHTPARRTRSDPGSSDAPTPSRIPRPTFVTRSSTFTEKVSLSIQNTKTSTSTKITKSSGQKITSPKKLKFTEKEKTSETSESQNSSVQRTSSRFTNTSVTNFDSAENCTVPLDHVTEEGNDVAEITQENIKQSTKISNGQEGSFSTSKRVSTIPGGLFTQSTEEDTLQKETQRLSNSSSNQKNAEDATMKSTRMARSEQKADQQTSDDVTTKAFTSPELSQSTNKEGQNDRNCENSLAISIPKIEIMEEAETIKESSDLMGKIEKIVEHHVQGMKSTSSGSPLNESSVPPGEVSTNKDNQQRPIEDILKALDNLCSMPSPKDVEISIDWAPIGEGMVNITEKILSPGITSLKGSKSSNTEEELKLLASTQRGNRSENCDHSPILTGTWNSSRRKSITEISQTGMDVEIPDKSHLLRSADSPINRYIPLPSVFPENLANSQPPVRVARQSPEQTRFLNREALETFLRL